MLRNIYLPSITVFEYRKRYIINKLQVILYLKKLNEYLILHGSNVDQLLPSINDYLSDESWLPGIEIQHIR